MFNPQQGLVCCDLIDPDKHFMRETKQPVSENRLFFEERRDLRVAVAEGRRAVKLIFLSIPEVDPLCMKGPTCCKTDPPEKLSQRPYFAV